MLHDRRAESLEAGRIGRWLDKLVDCSDLHSKACTVGLTDHVGMYQRFSCDDFGVSIGLDASETADILPSMEGLSLLSRLVREVQYLEMMKKVNWRGAQCVPILKMTSRKRCKADLRL